MKTFIHLAALSVFCLGLAACSSADKKEQEPQYQRKIYLTEEDYLEDLDRQAYAERREAKPNVESEYIFDVQPDTQKNVYFFDDRQRPMVPGVPSERDYRQTKRLWEKPRRYSPDQYYGTADDSAAAPADTYTDTSSSYDSYGGYDY